MFGMKKFILQLIGLALVVYYLLPYLVDGISVEDYQAAIIAALVFAFINIAVKPIVKIVTLPLNIVTLGLFGFIVNVLLFWFVASIISGFTVATFTAALFGAIVMTAANWLIEKIVD
jgi:putative membrane protein